MTRKRIKELEYLTKYIIWIFVIIILKISILFAITINIAHLQPKNAAIFQEQEVLQMCAKDLKRRNILPQHVDFRLIIFYKFNFFYIILELLQWNHVMDLMVLSTHAN